MIDLYTWTTPNGRKVSILLEEMGLEYEVHAIDIMKGDQYDPEFLKISPNNKIPAIRVRETGFTLFESGAILLWLATTHRRFIPEGDEYWRCVEWLMWQMGGLGPMLGQAHHFVHFNPDASDYARERYATEARRLYGVLDRRLTGRDWLAGAGRGEYTIADIACWPWVSRFEWQGIDLADFPAVRDWYCRIAERPAVQRGYHVPKKVGEIPMP
ncbi:MAG: glutathione S-transferase [Alphaproteobacteria bacterium]|nr:MAG: glutathione S-transferase [Alphaproteobacteria bacterium]